jgi:DNA-binding NarL/FixJ family response regulator
MRVLVVDDHALFTDAILPVLEAMEEFDVLGVARGGREGLTLARRERPELALVDLGLPDMSGIVLGRRILEEMPGTQVIALTGRKDSEAVSEAMAAGFSGYLTKDISMATFAERVRSALNGEVVVPEPVRSPPPPARTPEAENAELLARQLTNRELQVLSLLIEGCDNAEIADRLGVSANTVRTHVQSILTKLGVRSRLQAAAFAVRHRVVEAGTRRRLM